MIKESKLTVFKYRGRVFWRISSYFMSISQLCISVPLSTSCTDFTVNSNFSANRRSYLQCFSWLMHWTKRFCADFSRSVANRMQVITKRIHQNTLINGMRLFFSLKIRQNLFFESFRKRFKAKSYISTAQLTKIHSTVEMFSPRHLDTNDQILNTAHDA